MSTDHPGWRIGREKRHGKPPIELGSRGIRNGDTPWSTFFCFQAFAEICSTKVSPGHVRSNEDRFVEDCPLQICSSQIGFAVVRSTEVYHGHVRSSKDRLAENCSIQFCATQIGFAKICSLQVRAAEDGTAYVCPAEMCLKKICIAQISASEISIA
jgi:hypothetical protein